MAGIISDLVGTIGGALGAFGSKLQMPEVPNININQIQKDAATQNLAVLPDAEKLAAGVNQFNSDQIAKMISAVMPDYKSMFAKASGNAASLMAGELPSDVTTSVMNSSAAKALGGGYGGSGLGKNLTLRDLGLTSLQAEQMGLSQFSGLLGMAKETSAPLYNFTNAFMSPGQRLAFAEDQQKLNFDRNVVQRKADSQPDPNDMAMIQYGGALGDDILSMVAGGGMGGAMGAAAGGMSGGGFGGAKVGTAAGAGTVGATTFGMFG